MNDHAEDFAAMRRQKKVPIYIVNRVPERGEIIRLGALIGEPERSAKFLRNVGPLRDVAQAWLVQFAAGEPVYIGVQIEAQGGTR